MRFRHAFRIRAPVAVVADFHRQRESLSAITPPPVRVRVEWAPTVLSEGDQTAMVLLFGPLSLRWLAQIEAVSAGGFLDRQLQGPFRSWAHRHSFAPVGADVTLVLDEVWATPRRHLLWGPVGLGLWLSLPVLFAYRAWKTRRLLECPR